MNRYRALAMKKIIPIIILLFFIKFGISQEILLMGKIVNYQDLYPMEFTSICIDSFCCISNDKGQFSMIIPFNKLSDTLKIRHIGQYDLNIINIPHSDTIDFRIIPIFEYFIGYDMTHFYCKPLDFACRKKEKKHFEKVNNEYDSYYKKMDSIIEYFRYIFNGQTYKIDLKTNCIDLSKNVKY
jgi:hypothetical protein